MHLHGAHTCIWLRDYSSWIDWTSHYISTPTVKLVAPSSTKGSNAMALGIYSLARNANALGVSGNAIWLDVSNLPRQRVGPRQQRELAQRFYMEMKRHGL